MDSNHKDGLSASLEDYLEIILRLEDESRVARAKDIADRLGVSRASVTGALKTLAEIIRRHETLKEFFQDFLQLESEHADANACRVEHAIDSQAMDRMVYFLSFMRRCPRTGEDWLESFRSYCKGKVQESRCGECLEKLKSKH
jgi:DtxR family Mn-dependent transcriptional regulator